MPTEPFMAADLQQFFLRHLAPHFKVHLCSGVAGQSLEPRQPHRLPCYAASGPSTRARQMTCPDLIVVDTVKETVALIVELEIDTGPKNLLGNFFAPFLIQEYRIPTTGKIYKVDSTHTAYFLVACLETRAETPRGQAALQKGLLVAEWMERARQLLFPDTSLAPLRAAISIIDDDWDSAKGELERLVRKELPTLFSC